MRRRPARAGPCEACTADIESSTVTRCSRPPVQVLLAAAERREDQRLAAVDDVRAVQLGRDVHGELGVAHRLLGDVGVGHRGDEVAAHREEHLGPAVAQRLDRLDRVEAVLARRLEVELVAQRVEEVPAGGRSQMPIVRSPWTLEWPRTGQSPAPGLPMLPWRNATLAISLMVATELRCWVMPIAQQITVRDGVAEHRGRLLDLRAGQPGRARAPASQSRSRTCAAYSSKPLVCSLDEVVVDGVPLEQQRADRLEQREVAVDPDRQVQVGERGAAADHAAWLLRVLEPDQPGLAQRVDRDDLRAVLLGDLERGEHPRVVGAGVLAGDHDQLGVVDVVEGDRALADADHLGQRDRGGLVAHVGAVGQVVGAERADEELVDERRLVGGLAGGVEDRLVRAGQPVEVLGRPARTRRPTRSARSGVPPGRSTIGSMIRPCWPSQ